MRNDTAMGQQVQGDKPVAMPMFHFMPHRELRGAESRHPRWKTQRGVSGALAQRHLAVQIGWLYVVGVVGYGTNRGWGVEGRVLRKIDVRAD